MLVPCGIPSQRRGRARHLVVQEDRGHGRRGRDDHGVEPRRRSVGEPRRRPRTPARVSVRTASPVRRSAPAASAEATSASVSRSIPPRSETKTPSGFDRAARRPPPRQPRPPVAPLRGRTSHRPPVGRARRTAGSGAPARRCAAGARRRPGSARRSACRRRRPRAARRAGPPAASPAARAGTSPRRCRRRPGIRGETTSPAIRAFSGHENSLRPRERHRLRRQHEPEALGHRHELAAVADEDRARVPRARQVRRPAPARAPA